MSETTNPQSTETDENCCDPADIEIVHDPLNDTIFGWILVQIKSALLTVWDMLGDLFLLIVDCLMYVGLYALQGVSSALELADITNYINGMPTEVLGIVNAIGLGEAIGMIMAAGTARLLMQLIPFVRLGS